MGRKTIRELEDELAEARAEAIKWQQLYFDLARQVKEDATKSEWYQAAWDEIKEERRALEYLRQSLGNKIPERVTVIPDQPKRGRKRTINTETRQYIHELAKIKNKEGQPVNSLGSIASITGTSKTAVYQILQEPEIPGRWYSIKNGERKYYDDYTAAVQSKKDIHFQVEK